MPSLPLGRVLPPPAAGARVLFGPRSGALPPLAAGVALVLLFHGSITGLVRDWWTSADAGHGLLLVPVAAWLVWKDRDAEPAPASPRLGLLLLLGAVVLRYLAGIAAERFTARLALLMAGAGLVVFYLGARRLLRWWLPCALVLLSVPLPEVVLGSVALPLQFQASRIGAALLEWRDVPVRLAGNVIHLPGRSLFVTEACSGLRSITSLLALALLVGGLWLRTVAARSALVLLAVAIAVLLNGVRVFLTGFMVFFLGPEFGEGFMHLSEGWGIFVVALLALVGCMRLLTALEARWASRG